MSETRRRETVDLDAEREVDLGSAWHRIAARWWLPVGGLAVGAVLGLLVSLGGGDVYQAKTLLYLGQPFTPGGGSQIVSLQTNPKAVSEIIRSEAAIREAADASDLRAGAAAGQRHLHSDRAGRADPEPHAVSAAWRSSCARRRASRPSWRRRRSRRA